MARLGRKPVRPGRVTMAVSLGTVGLFVISMAAGMQNWPFGAAGAAMLVVAVALLTTASMRGSDKAFVAGTVHVVKVSEPPLTTDFGRCEMQVLVDAPGHPGQTVMIRDPRVPVTKWPDVGETLPALVSVSDARRIKIQWDRVGTYGERYESEYLGEEVYDDESAGFTDEYPIAEPIVTPPPPPPTPPPPPPASDLPRRQPSSARTETHSVAVLEGELIPAEVPSQRASRFEDDVVEIIDFSDVPEPPEATPPYTGPVFTSPVFADPVFADPVFADPVFADPVFADPVFADPPVEPVMQTKPNARPASAGSIHGVGLTVLVTDLVRSLEFYRDLLGFYEVDGGSGTVILASGDMRLVLVTATELAPIHHRMVHLNLEVGDVDAVYRELKVRGVRFTYAPKVVNRGERLELVAAAFKDPDGHGIAITQWKARAS